MSNTPTRSSATSKLRLLVAEDSEDDYELLIRELRRGGYDLAAERVASAAEFEAALERAWDLVISDWVMPDFTGPSEEAAVQALRAGALDFLSKDKPRRLVPAVQRVLREAEESRAPTSIRR